MLGISRSPEQGGDARHFAHERKQLRNHLTPRYKGPAGAGDEAASGRFPLTHLVFERDMPLIKAAPEPLSKHAAPSAAIRRALRRRFPGPGMAKAIARRLSSSISQPRMAHAALSALRSCLSSPFTLPGLHLWSCLRLRIWSCGCWSLSARWRLMRALDIGSMPPQPQNTLVALRLR